MFLSRMSNSSLCSLILWILTINVEIHVEIFVRLLDDGFQFVVDVGFVFGYDFIDILFEFLHLC